MLSHRQVSASARAATAIGLYVASLATALLLVSTTAHAASDPRGLYTVTVTCTAQCSGQHQLDLAISTYVPRTGYISGSGHTQPPDPRQDFTGEGKYDGSTLSFTTSGGAGYQVSGSVSGDGSISGSG